MIAVVSEMSPSVGVEAACDAIGLARATFYRILIRGRPGRSSVARRPSPRALRVRERRDILDLLHSIEFVDLAPAQIVAKLLDMGRYLCSERTMYRILASEHECRERRMQLRRPHYAAPELLATGPNQLWSWDITKLHGSEKWTYYYLYVILDVFSRRVVGWLVAHRECASLAEKLIRETCQRERIERDQLTLHADRGSSMKSKPVALLLADLGVIKTHSRPHVSNDNPFSEAQFKTLKYRPDFPGRFGCLQDARAFCVPFFDWYNTEHRHSGIGLYTPAQVHSGTAAHCLLARATVLAAAFAAHPERFPNGLPKPQPPPTEVWINKPKPFLAQ